MKQVNDFRTRKFSKRVQRRDYSKIKLNFDSPDLLETQKGSFVKLPLQRSWVCCDRFWFSQSEIPALPQYLGPPPPHLQMRPV